MTDEQIVAEVLKRRDSFLTRTNLEANAEPIVNALRAAGRLAEPPSEERFDQAWGRYHDEAVPDARSYPSFSAGWDAALTAAGAVRLGARPTDARDEFRASIAATIREAKAEALIDMATWLERPQFISSYNQEPPMLRMTRVQIVETLRTRAAEIREKGEQ